MSIQKTVPNYLRHQPSPYTNIINETMALIPDAAALGIYVYLLSKPENWEIHITELMRRFNKGRDYIASKLKILKEIGLYKVQSIRDSSGKILHWETVLYKYIPNQITENPESGKEANSQITENPESGKTRFWETPPPNKERALVIKDVNKKAFKSSCISKPEKPKQTRQSMRAENEQKHHWHANAKVCEPVTKDEVVCVSCKRPTTQCGCYGVEPPRMPKEIAKMFTQAALAKLGKAASPN
jgi:hypothetical protein